MIKAIARQLGVARNTVRTAVRDSDPPNYQRKPKGSLVDAVEPDICALLKETPTMPATVIAERIGWEHGITILRDRVAELRPLFRPPDPCQRTFYTPGELVQFDLWQPETPIPVGFDLAEKLWVVTAVSGYSRFMASWMVPTPCRPRRAGRHARAAWSKSEGSRAPRCGTARAASDSGAEASSATPRTSSASEGPSAWGRGFVSPVTPKPKG